MATSLNKPPARVTEATEAAARAARARDAVQITVDRLTMEAAAVAARIKVLEGVMVKVPAQAWCADLTENATGDVGTLEIPGEGKLVLIVPGAEKPKGADGALAAREAQGPAQVFFNAAILPGWQKFKPTFRRGVITAVSATLDTADVTLEAADTSSAQGLGINQAATLAGVPVKYMTCNAGAFEVGDRCVVQFKGQDWAAPEVVGFVDNPKPCGAALLVVWLAVETAMPIASYGGPNPWAYANTGQMQYKRWIYRLHPADPLDIDRARLEDYAVTTHTMAATGVSTTGPEFDSWQGTYDWGRLEVVVTVAQEAGGLGHAAGQVLLYSGRVVTAAASQLLAWRVLDNYTAFARYFEREYSTTAGWRAKDWGAEITERKVGSGYDLDYFRFEPTGPAYADTTTGSITTSATWALVPAGAATGGPALVFNLATRPTGAGGTTNALGPHTLVVGESSAPAPAPALAPLSGYPVRATPYSKAELGPLPSTKTFFIRAGAVYARTGQTIRAAYVGSFYAALLSGEHLLALDRDTGVLQMRLTDGAPFGAAVGLQRLMVAQGGAALGVPDADAAEAVALAGTWSPLVMGFSKAMPAAPAGVRRVRALQVQMVYDNKEGADPTALWPKLSGAGP